MFTIPTLGFSGSTPVDETRAILSRGDWAITGFNQSGDNSEVFAKHTSSVAHPEDAPLLRIGIYINRAANGGLGQTNVSYRLTVPVELDSSRYDKPLVMTLAWTLPGVCGAIDIADLMKLFFSLFDMVMPVDATTSTDTVLTKLAYGVPSIPN